MSELLEGISKIEVNKWVDLCALVRAHESKQQEALKEMVEKAYREGWEDGRRPRPYVDSIDNDWQTCDTKAALASLSQLISETPIGGEGK